MKKSKDWTKTATVKKINGTRKEYKKKKLVG